MDLSTITEVERRPAARPGADWRDGDAWLAGGTWLFSVEQPELRRLVDLTSLGWEPLARRDDGLDIAATCTIHDLYGFVPPADWTAGPLLRVACEAFLSSFKVWNSATVGGNICMSLPAGPMISLSVALEATYTIWQRDGSERTVPAVEFVTGDNENVLTAGEVLRSIHLPATSLRRRFAWRRLSLVQLGRSSVFLIGTHDPATDELLLTITAATTHPVQLRFAGMPDAVALHDRLADDIADDLWFDDPNGTPDHRKHVTSYFAEQLRTELAGTTEQGAQA